MIRSPNDGVQLETPPAQSGSSSVGVPPATGGSTSCETPPENVPIPGPPLIDITTEAGLATDQPNQAARSAGATTSHRTTFTPKYKLNSYQIQMNGLR